MLCVCLLPPSLVHTVAPVAPAFGNVSWTEGQEGPVVSWEYWGPERNVYLEYVLKTSKHLRSAWNGWFLLSGGARDSYSTYLACAGVEQIGHVDVGST